MKKLVLSVVIIAFVFIANAGDEVKMAIDNPIEQIKHPKRKNFKGKVVTRADYVKTSNPKRLHWNRIREKDNPVPSNTISHFHKRRTLVKAYNKHRINVGPTKSIFVQRKRKHS